MKDALIDSPEGKYIVPSGDGTGSPLILDIQEIVRAECRLSEVATANAHNSAELLSVYSDNWGKLNRTVTLLTHQRNMAQHSLDVGYAEAILGADTSLVKRGIRASKETREAIAVLDPEVRSCTERLNEIKTVLSYIVGKAELFMNAYNSVKKLISGSSVWQPNQPLHSPRPNPNQQFATRESWTADDDGVLDMPAGFADPHKR